MSPITQLYLSTHSAIYALFSLKWVVDLLRLRLKRAHCQISLKALKVVNEKASLEAVRRADHEVLRHGTFKNKIDVIINKF
jgi:hypothetical protein